MNYRRLGKTGVMVSEVGMGGNRLGEREQPDDHWIRLVQKATDLGVTVFDTSESYGRGRSEEMLGRALGNRKDIYIASKMSISWEPGGKSFSSQLMMKSVEGSLKRLRRDIIDIYQLHSPARKDMEEYDWVDGMKRLKDQGKIRVMGVAVNSVADGIWLMEQNLVEMLQITYNIFETEAGKTLFNMAEERGVGLLCRMPLARGVLTGKFEPNQEIPDGHRAKMDGQRAIDRVKIVEKLKPLASDYPGGITRMALHFSLTPKAMSAIIPGARTIEQLEENVASSNGVGLPTHIYEAISRIRG
jgi:aryl-alcohol dehydrogenase-like predicted oxidoreductase